MKSKVSFIVLDHAGSRIRQITLSKPMLLSIQIGFVALLIVSVFILFDNIRFRKARVEKRILKETVAKQQAEIDGHREQIGYFAQEINSLKSKLVELNHFEKQIKQVVGIEESGDKDHLFGIGGTIPEDIDPGAAIKNSYPGLIREMHDQMKQVRVATANQSEGFESFMQYVEDQRNLLAATPSIRPAKGWYTSRFGHRTSPITGLKEFHKGLDIAAPTGTPIIAPADGMVSFSGSKGAMGKMLVIDHGHGLVTRYGHIQKALKKKGHAVKRGETIGLVGKTGRTTGSHLHYEVLMNGVHVNPVKYILN